MAADGFDVQWRFACPYSLGKGAYTRYSFLGLLSSCFYRASGLLKRKNGRGLTLHSVCFNWEKKSKDLQPPHRYNARVPGDAHITTLEIPSSDTPKSPRGRYCFYRHRLIISGSGFSTFFP